MSRTVMFCGINLNIDPHPPGVYVSALNDCSNITVQSRGDNYCKITSPVKIDGENAYKGLILTWVEIDTKAPWINIIRNEELTKEELAKIVIPEIAKPNFRAYEYIFVEKNHRIYVEIKNYLGNTLGPTVVLSIFRSLFSRTKYKNLTCSLVPDEDSLLEMINLPNIKRIDLRINMPNSDYADSAARKRVRSKLSVKNVKQWDQTFIAQDKENPIEVDEELEEFLRVAADTGFARAISIDESGTKTEIATDKKPKKWVLPFSDGASIFTSIKARFNGLI